MHYKIIILFYVLFVQGTETNVHWKDESLGVFVLDGLFKNLKALQKLQHKLTTKIPLRFNGDLEVYRKFLSLSGFQSRYPVDSLYGSKFVAKVEENIKSLYFSSPEFVDKHNVHILSLNVHIIEASDFNPILSTCTEKNSEIFAAIFLSSNWEKNNYGDFGIYNGADELKISVHPKLGKTLLIRCGIKFKINQPAIGKDKRLYLVLMEFGHTEQSNLLTKKQKQEESFSLIHNSLPQNILDFAFNEQLNVADYISNKIIYGETQRKIFVFDNLFPDQMVTRMYDFVVKHGSYYEEEIDVDSEDNVRWLLGLEDSQFEDGPVWSILKKVNMYISNSTKYTPYDITCNHIRRTDITMIHKDCQDKENELTNLLYLNPLWKPDLYGETIFLDNDEFITAVMPKFGRLVVFDGNIDHSARPPSPKLNGARYTLAVKTTTNLVKKKLLNS